MNKVHRSALCIIPPSHQWSQIQKIRSVHDKSYIRWMPHINIMYPFYEDVGYNFEEIGREVAGAIQSLSPFKVILGEFDFFKHSKSTTVWLKPSTSSEADEPLQSLHHALLQAFPDCDDLSNDVDRGIRSFTPHLSVGQWNAKSGTAVQTVIDDLSREWNPIEFQVESLALISRKGFKDPFKIRYVIPLGGGDGQRTDRSDAANGLSRRDDVSNHFPSIKEVNIPYIASLTLGNTVVDEKQSLSDTGSH